MNNYTKKLLTNPSGRVYLIITN